MAISFIGARGATTTTITIPTHQSGDLILIFAYRDGSSTAPTVPANWNVIGSSGGSLNSSAFAWRRATSNSTLSGTWTNATELICLVYRGTSIGASIGGSGIGTSTINYPALTLDRTDGSSWVVGVAGHRTATNVELAPSGMTNRTSAGTEAAGHDTNGGVTTWASTNVTVNASNTYRSWVVELRDQSLSLDATVDSFTLSGNSIDLNKLFTLDLTTQNFILDGVNATLLSNFILNGTTQNYLLDGIDNNLLCNRLLSQNLGVFNLTGIDTLLDYQAIGGNSLDALVGAFSLAGSNVELAILRGLLINSGSFATTGVNAALIKSSLLNLISQTYQVSGNLTNFGYLRYLNLTAEDFNLNSSTLTLQRNYAVKAIKQSFTITDVNAKLQASRLLNLNTETFDYDTVQANFFRNYPLLATTTTFDLNSSNLEYFASRYLNAKTKNLIVYVQDGSNLFRYYPNKRPVTPLQVPTQPNQWVFGRFTSMGKRFL